MEAFEDFALRHENWVIWNLSEWRSGWIELRVTVAKSTPNAGRVAFRVGWNGNRFSQGNELARLTRFDPDVEQILTSYLARVLPCPMVAA